MGSTEILAIVSGVCCCLGAVLIVAIGIMFAMRSKEPRGADVAGIAPAPQRGVATKARLTLMEEEEALTTRVRREDAAPSKPNYVRPSPTIVVGDDDGPPRRKT